MKNKISTLSYFMKRLRDTKYIVWKIFDGYNVGDPRKWTVLVNPGYHSLYITCYINQDSLNNEATFSFDDGEAWGISDGKKLQTKSMEIIVNKLMDLGVTPDSGLYVKGEKNNDG